MAIVYDRYGNPVIQGGGRSRAGAGLLGAGGLGLAGAGLYADKLKNIKGSTPSLTEALGKSEGALKALKGAEGKTWEKGKAYATHGLNKVRAGSREYLSRMVRMIKKHPKGAVGAGLGILGATTLF